MQDNSWHINYYIFIYHFESRKSGYEGEKKKMSWESKELFRWNKKHFSYFLKGYYLVKKNKNRRRKYSNK